MLDDDDDAAAADDDEDDEVEWSLDCFDNGGGCSVVILSRL